MKFDVCSLTNAELLDRMHCLKIAEDKGLNNVIIHMNLEVVINKLKAEAKQQLPYHLIAKECQTLLNYFNWNARLSHCYGEANRAIDQCANFGIDLAQQSIILDLLWELCGVARLHLFTLSNIVFLVA